ncbi:VacJ family lipoprotein [soil metagenome]
MKIHSSFLPFILAGLSAPLFTSCTTTSPKPPASTAAVATTGHGSKSDGKSYKSKVDDLSEYDVATIADPLEPINRGTFWLNHQLYTFIFKPISKSYETVVPKPVRKGIYNVFDNIEFPVRFVSDTLQGNFKRAGLETGRFVVNSTVGVGGLGRPADHIPALANVPAGEVGLTFAKWGVGHGFYFVIPLLGPSSARDTVGLAGDYALNPVTWLGFIYGTWAWTIPVSVTGTVSYMPDKFAKYDAMTKNTLDKYLAARTAYVQYRKEAAKK